MKKRYKILLFLIAGVTVLAISFAFGSIDMPTYDSHGLADVISEVPIEDNGYTELAFIEHEDFVLFDTDEDRARLSEYARVTSREREVWDEEFVLRVLHEKAEYISALRASLSYSAFQLPVTYLHEMPDRFAYESSSFIGKYSNLRSLLDLCILMSRYLAENGDISGAIEFVSVSIDFSQRIKTESSYEVLSHISGIELQQKVLVWAQRLAIEYALTSEQHAELIAVLDSVPSYTEDGYRHVFSGALATTKASYEYQRNMSHSERLVWQKQIRDIGQPSNGEEPSVLGNLQSGLSARMNGLFMRYALHVNSSLGIHARAYAHFVEESDKYCADMDLQGWQDDAFDRNWTDAFKPNMIGKIFAAVAIPASGAESYFTRRCLGHTDIASTKAILALTAFQKVEARLPESLDELVPLYLSVVPVDPFDGKPLRYSKADRYVYSVGANFEDNGGSIENIYDGLQSHYALRENPTYLMY